MVKMLKRRGLVTLLSPIVFPPEGFVLPWLRSTTPPPLEYSSYYKLRAVERVPKALRMLHQQLSQLRGGIVVLDSDFSDTLLISIHLIHSLQSEGYLLVPMETCVRVSDPQS